MSVRFMEFATIEQTLVEDRDEHMRLAEAALDRGDMTTFHKHAREYHRLASEVGYPAGLS